VKVKDLQNLLNTLDPELHIVCYSVDEIVRHRNGFPMSFEILDLQAKKATLTRLHDEGSGIMLGTGPYSSTFALIEITADV
jgi:hypothetical protein